MYRKINKVTLNDISEKIIDGLHNLPKDVIDYSPYPILSAKNIENNTLNFETKKYVSKATYEKENKRTETKEGDILLTIVGAIGRSIVLDNSVQALFQRSICIIRPKKNLVNPKFLNYILSSPNYQKRLFDQSHGAAQKGIYLNKLKKLEILLPSLEEQEKIVETLDKLTEIKDNSEELIQKQLKRIIMLKDNSQQNLIKRLFKNSQNHFKLGDYINIKTGQQLNKSKLLENGAFKVMNGGIEPSGYWNEYNTEAETIIVSQGGNSAGYVNYMTEKFWAGAHCYVITITSENLGKEFLYSFLKTSQNKIRKQKVGAGIPGLNRKIINNLEIPNISTEYQKEIADLWYKAEEDANSLRVLLEKQLINLNKIYTYYFNKLLDFGDEL